MTQPRFIHPTLTALVDERFIRLYPTTKTADLAKDYGVSVSTINRLARHYGLKKDIEHRKAQQRANATGSEKSPETREKIAEKARGRTLSKETKDKIMKTKEDRGSVPSGEKHYNWKGGKPWERFSDPRYINWRNSVLERDDYICQDCGKQCNKREKGLVAHHIKPYATHPELRLDISNGATLCQSCHTTRHSREPLPKDPIPCACGCGAMIAPFDTSGRPRTYALYHGPRKGSDQHNAVLTEDNVRQIRLDGRKQHEIAADYGISRVNVSRIKSGKSWKHVV